MARILVVDDQPQILIMIESLLTKRGHVVTTAKDAFDAIEKLKAQPFEMVITDAVMPGGASGFDLTKTLRKDPTLQGILIILLTGKREKKDVDRGISAGVDDYSIKPVDPALFLAKVDALLQKRGQGGNTFTECTISEMAKYQLDLKMVGISEVGLSFHSAQPFHVGTKIKIGAEFFGKIGMDVPVLRVMTCERSDKEEQFVVRVQYIGLTEISLQPLRVWIRSRQLSRAV